MSHYLRNFLGEPKNKDHVSCFSIWKGRDGSEFSQVPKPIYGERDVYHYELTCCVLTARVCGGHEYDLPKHSHFRGLLL